MTARLLAAAAGGALMLAACAEPGATACQTANRDVSLGTLLVSSTTGAYDECLADLRDELQTLQLQARALEAEAARLDALSASLDGERRAAAGRLAQLNASQADLMRRIAEEGAASSAADVQVQSLVDQEAALRAEIARSGEGVDTATADALLDRQIALDALARQIL